MRKYIDADRLEKDGWSMVRIRQASPTEMVYETKKPTDFPAVDVVEAWHGRWKGGKCSICGEHALFWMMSSGYYASPYCPNCGALMINEDEEMSKVSEMEMAYGEYLNG